MAPGWLAPIEILKNSQVIEQILSRGGEKPLDKEQSTVLEQVTAPFPFSEAIAQAIILAARELEGAAKMTFDQSKRETLHKLAASLLAITGVSQVGSLAMLDAEQQRWLASPRQTSSASQGYTTRHLIALSN